jgi:hypothetical protein
MHLPCPIALPVRQNSQHRSLLTVVSATSAPPFQPLRHQRNICHTVVNRFTWQTLPTVNRKHSLWISFALSPCIDKKKERATERYSSVVHSSSTVAILINWNHPLNMRMRVCYLDCHEAGLCCYLVIYRTPIASITTVSLPLVTLRRKMEALWWIYVKHL